MKKLLCLTVALSALASPALTFAQTTPAPLTRAQMRADLIRVEQAGYSPGTANDPYYPADIQTAEAKAATQQDMAQDAPDAVGGTSPMGASGAGTSTPAGKTAQCVGPITFCDTYSGS
jgi:hypothetical protein